jgi:hypothetical protein
MSKIETTVSVDWRIFPTNHFTTYLLNPNRSPINGNFKVTALRSTSKAHWYSEARMVTTHEVSKFEARVNVLKWSFGGIYLHQHQSH